MGGRGNEHVTYGQASTNEHAHIASLTQLGCKVTISVTWQSLMQNIYLFFKQFFEAENS